MSILLVQRRRRRLRKPSPSGVESRSNDSAAAESPLASIPKESRPRDDVGVVRVNYTVRPRHAELIESILVTVRRSTGSACNASDVARLAFDELEKLPMERIVDLLSNQEKQKRKRG